MSFPWNSTYVFRQISPTLSILQDFFFTGYIGNIGSSSLYLYLYIFIQAYYTHTLYLLTNKIPILKPFFLNHLPKNSF